MNTPRLCMTETKKAFRALLKKEDLPSAIQALCNLKGVGPAMASSKEEFFHLPLYGCLNLTLVTVFANYYKLQCTYILYIIYKYIHI